MLEQKISSIETKIEALDKEKSEIEEQMADPGIYSDHEKLLEANQKYEQLQKQIRAHEQEWEELVTKMENSG